MEFFQTLRELTVGNGERVFIDFHRLKAICPRGALLLAAEIDRWRQVRNFRPRVKVKGWDKQIFRLLDDMGLFDLVNVVNAPPRSCANDDDMVFIRFRSENQTLGTKIKELSDSIEEITGEALLSRKLLYRGLIEAMSNVANHAYPSDVSYKLQVLSGQWWMFASYRKSARRLTVCFFDQGVGIPESLPRKHTLPIVGELLNLLGLTDTDSSRIKAAAHLGTSKTGQPNRGKGLSDMKRFTEMVKDGCLRIISGRGEYTYNSDGTDDLRDHEHDIGGTLIQWSASL